MVGPADILSARILVVDDASVNVLLLERILRRAGYASVTTTTDPRAVCDLYREHRYDLILLDLMMPGMDGFQVMGSLKDIETEGYLPVLVLTAQPGHKLRALQAGAKEQEASKLPPEPGSVGTANSCVEASIASKNAIRSSSLPACASTTLMFALPAFVWNCHRVFVNRSFSEGDWPACK